MSASHYRIDVYGAHLHVTSNETDWDRLSRQYEVDEDPGLGLTTLTVDTHGNVPHILIHVDSAAHSSEADVVTTLAHESAHAASMLLDHFGHRLRGEDEPHAYLAGFVARCVWTHLERETR